MKPTDLVVTRWGARFMGRRFACSIGKGGFSAQKKEGDGATPTQVMRMVGGAYRADRGTAPHVPFPLTQIGPSDIWSDDPSDPNYNQPLSDPSYVFSHESLRRGDPLYDLVIYTDHNYPDATPGAGSAIFVHQWRKPRHPTEGCIAFSRADLRWILNRWQHESRIIIRSW
ncbi:L,D-transpeptidase [Falsihalocynthiibacter sp. SS001]|uniref:L,D-transpeptidase family protein n=1 Tax=Falsihalocynthiibacter sp. SS001 TaxID=3349698 RepID=UPI0036D37DE5